MTLTDETLLDATHRQPRVIGVGIVTLVVAAAVIASFWLIARPSEFGVKGGDGKVMDYTTVQAMAEHMGCSSSLRPTQNPGSSSSAGECTYEGALIEFRIYPTEPQALAWLEGNRSQSLDVKTGIYDSIGLYAGKWVVVFHSTDLDLVNRAGAAVQR
ncbi:MAG TPA: hypothetical protein VLL08_16920 [Kineosporiaceae bacterium]|nr:hypothetical protein [Kineosporiaceae bacterium]